MDYTFGVWEVVLKDGTTTNQFDKDNPNFIVIPEMPTGGEVPFRAIPWNDVTNITFYRQDGTGDSFNVGTVAGGYHLSLRSRTFKSMAGGEMTAFILLISKDGEEAGPESTEFALYWLPDGTAHECNLFDCPDIRKYAHAKVWGRHEPLMPKHGTVRVRLDAVIA